MDDETIDPNDPGFIDVTRRLEAYADKRLTPTAAATTRMRTNVMNSVQGSTALTDADATLDDAGPTTSSRTVRRSGTTRHALRRTVVVVVAVMLVLAVVTGTVSAAKAGGPLYGARIWTEMVTLPTDLVARAQAEVDRLDERLQEAEGASTAGDWPATEAALVAYSTIIVEAATGTGGDPTASNTIVVSVTRYIVVLTRMVETVPEPARAAAREAVTTSSKVVDDLAGAGDARGRDDRGDT